MPRTQSKPENETNYEIINVQTWDISGHSCGMPKPNKSGKGKSAMLSYNGRKFYLKTPKMFAPFGASCYKGEKSDSDSQGDKWSVNMAFGSTNQEISEECGLFNKKLLELDDFMIENALKEENQTAFLGPKKSSSMKWSKDIINATKYKSIIKFSKDPKTKELSTQYPAFIRPSFILNKDKTGFTTEIYDKKNQLISVSTNENDINCINKVVCPRSKCTALLQGNVWVTESGFGIAWRIVQMKLFPAEDSIPKGICLVNDPDDDDEGDDVNKEEKNKDEIEDEGKDEDKDEDKDEGKNNEGKDESSPQEDEGDVPDPEPETPPKVAIKVSPKTQ